VSRREALAAAARATHERTPRTWGALNFLGSPFEQRLASRLLGDEEEASRARKQLQELMTDSFPKRVRHHAQKWQELSMLQQRAIERIVGIPDLDTAYEKHLSFLQAGLESVKKGTELPSGFIEELKESSANIYFHWDRAQREDRIALLEQRIKTILERQRPLQDYKKAASREFENLKMKTELWLNPWALEQWLEAGKSTNKFIP
jgi:hypothetical protein